MTDSTLRSRIYFVKVDLCLVMHRRLLVARRLKLASFILSAKLWQPLIFFNRCSKFDSNISNDLALLYILACGSIFICSVVSGVYDDWNEWGDLTMTWVPKLPNIPSYLISVQLCSACRHRHTSFWLHNICTYAPRPLLMHLDYNPSSSDLL